MGTRSVPHFQGSHCSEEIPQRLQGGPRGHSGCKCCCCSSPPHGTWSLPGGTCRPKRSQVALAAGVASQTLPGNILRADDGDSCCFQKKGLSPESLQECPMPEVLQATSTSSPNAWTHLPDTEPHGQKHRQIQTLRRAPHPLHPPLVSSPGPGDGPLLLPVQRQHLISHGVDLQAVAAPMTPGVLFGAGKEQVLGQGPSEAEGGLAFPQVPPLS